MTTINRLDQWNIGKTHTLIGRAQSRDGTGAATGYPREGKYILAAQVSVITLKLYDLDADDPSAVVEDIVITSAAIIAAVTSGFTYRDENLGGYNFEFDYKPSSSVMTAGRTYKAILDILLTTGTQLDSAAWEGVACSGVPG